MQAFGVYFDIIQATQTPKLWDLSILVWGVIFFTVFSVSVIAQLWYHIHKMEGSYAYALAAEIDESSVSTKGGILQLALIFSNMLDRPLGYKVDGENTYFKIGNEITETLRSNIMGGVIVKGKPERRLLSGVKYHENFPYQGILRCEVLYGAPGKLSFKQVRGWNVEFTRGVGGGVEIFFTTNAQDDYSLRSKLTIGKILGLNKLKERIPE